MLHYRLRVFLRLCIIHESNSCYIIMRIMLAINSTRRHSFVLSFPSLFFPSIEQRAITKLITSNWGNLHTYIYKHMYISSFVVESSFADSPKIRATFRRCFFAKLQVEESLFALITWSTWTIRARVPMPSVDDSARTLAVRAISIRAGGEIFVTGIKTLD